MAGDVKELLTAPKQDRRDVFEMTARRLDTLPGYVEKDLWVCIVLDVLYNREDRGGGQIGGRSELDLYSSPLHRR